jgi:DNA-binding PadR family transcriptional regulator
MKTPLPEWLYKPLTPTELYVLILLIRHPANAYTIASTIRINFRASATTTGIKRALTRLQHYGWVQTAEHIVPSGRNEHYYQLTPFGRSQLITELNRLEPILMEARDYLHLTASS